MVEGVRRGDSTDQNQHDQPHALLPVVGPMQKAYARAGEDEQGANPERRWLSALGRFV